MHLLCSCKEDILREQEDANEMKASSVFLAGLFFMPVMFASSESDDSTGAEAQQQQTMSKDERDDKGSLLDDLLGIAGCIHECSSSSSSSASSSSCDSSSSSCCSLSFSFSSEEGHDGVGDVVIAAGTMTLQHSILFYQPTVRVLFVSFDAS